MAKQITELEVTDIDLSNNKLHQQLSILLPLSVLSYSGRKPQDGETQTDFHNRISKEAIVLFLNALDRSGFVLSPKEDIPSAFTRDA